MAVVWFPLKEEGRKGSGDKVEMQSAVREMQRVHDRVMRDSSREGSIERGKEVALHSRKEAETLQKFFKDIFYISK